MRPLASQNQGKHLQSKYNLEGGSTLIKINRYEILFARSKIDGFSDSETTGIYKYNIKSNQFELFIKYPNHFQCMRTFSGIWCSNYMSAQMYTIIQTLFSDLEL